METTTHNDDILQQMRDEMRELKETLSTQMCVTDHMMRSAMASKGEMAGKQWIISLLAIVLTVPCFFFLWHQGVVSLPFAIVTELMLAVFAIVNYRINLVHDKDYMSLPLTELQRVIIRRHDRRHLSQQIGIAVCVVWICWYCHEIYQSTHVYSVIVGSIVGGLIGGLMGYRWYRKLQRKDREILSAIEELESAN